MAGSPGKEGDGDERGSMQDSEKIGTVERKGREERGGQRTLADDSRWRDSA